MHRILTELRGITPTTATRDLGAALAITFMAVPQGIAYALIAGLDPIVGLYAATIPTIVGSLFRSSRFVVAGPTNAISLLVGMSVPGLSETLGLTPEAIAIQLALLVGLMQATAGVFRLGSLVDYISKPVVLGYIVGAAGLIGYGQLKHVDTGVAVGVAAAVVVTIVALRKIDKRIPAALIALAAATGASVMLGLPITELRDLSPIASGLPPLTLPGLPDVALLSVAAAVTVLSLVESSSVARNLADLTGDRLDASQEFLGQGLSNISAAFFGGYPVSGSLARSKLNHQVGAKTRLSGVFSGLLVVIVLLFAGPLVERIPIAALAGLLLVVAWDLVDVKRIKVVLKAGLSDKAAFLTTVAGTWLLPLDKAIYLGVAISIALFVRRASLLVVRELVPEGDRLVEVSPRVDEVPAVRILHVEGALFFGSAAELRQALEDAARPDATKVVVVRLKRAQGLDVTCLDVLTNAATSMKRRGKLLILAGMRQGAMDALTSSGAVDVLGAENLFPTRRDWFVAMDNALERAVTEAAENGPVAAYLDHRHPTPRNA
ncbi:MAG: SulP family inorganic anion transporter [Proteobacteria bacterium]|nr:SulP family inorganic anion transporter [Pseudomonadota bacterium]MCP4919917.1 SulP family inorganic anion transporter [Pseudomonadota bacterium]